MNEIFEQIFERNTVEQKVVNLATDLITQIEEKAWNILAYSLATDESTDATDTAQLLYLRGVNPGFFGHRRVTMYAMFT